MDKIVLTGVDEWNLKKILNNINSTENVVEMKKFNNMYILEKKKPLNARFYFREKRL